MWFQYPTNLHGTVHQRIYDGNSCWNIQLALVSCLVSIGLTNGQRFPFKVLLLGVFRCAKVQQSRLPEFDRHFLQIRKSLSMMVSSASKLSNEVQSPKLPRVSPLFLHFPLKIHRGKIVKMDSSTETSNVHQSAPRPQQIWATEIYSKEYCTSWKLLK